jgi:hypothetical protein
MVSKCGGSETQYHFLSSSALQLRTRLLQQTLTWTERAAGTSYMTGTTKGCILRSCVYIRFISRARNLSLQRLHRAKLDELLVDDNRSTLRYILSRHNCSTEQVLQFNGHSPTPHNDIVRRAGQTTNRHVRISMSWRIPPISENQL